MADINDMDLNVAAGIAQDEYEAPSEFTRPPEPGQYTFLRRENPKVEWSKDKKDLYFKFDAIVQGGKDDGRKVDMFISTTTSQWRKSTSADDFVHACGSQVTPSGTSKQPLLKDYRDAVVANSGPFDAVLMWRGYCTTCEEDTIGGSKQPKFPTTEDGTLSHIMECPKCGTKIGARARVLRFVVT